MSLSHPYIAEVRLPILQAQIATRIFLPLFDSHRVCGDELYGYLAMRQTVPPQQWHDPLVPGLLGPRTMILGLRTLHKEHTYANMIRCCPACEIPVGHDYYLGRAVPQDTRLVQQGLGKVATAALLARYWPTDGQCRWDTTCALMGGLLRHQGWSVLQISKFVEAITHSTVDFRRGLRGFANLIATYQEHAQRMAEELHIKPANVTGFKKLSSLFAARGPVLVNTIGLWLDLKKQVIEVNTPQTITARDWDRIGDKKEDSIIFKLSPQRRFRLSIIEDAHQKQSSTETLEMLIDMEYSSLQERGCPI